MKFSKTLAAAALVTGAMAISTPAFAAEPIVGNWKTADGPTAKIAPCGGAFCATLTSGKFAGKRIGRFSGSGSSYRGTLTDPKNDKTYSGTGKLSGSSLRLKGCALKIFCKTQNWKKL